MNENILERVRKLAEQLIPVPSTADNPEALKNVLAIVRQELEGFHMQEFESNGIHSLLISNKETKNFKILLNAHLDVVPANDYSLVEKDGRWYGRGAYDMKVTTAVMILLFKELAEKLPYSVGLQIVTDEEIAGFFGAKYQIDEGVRAEFVISGDVSDLKINNQSKGILWVKIKTMGKSAHGAYPWNGENALDKLQKVLEKLKILYPHPEEGVWRTTINIARIETPNSVFNKVPEEATAFVDIRFIPQESATIMQAVQSAVEPDAEVEVIFKEDAQNTDENDVYVQQLKKSIETITGDKAKMIETHGGSDIRFFEDINIPAVCFSPHGFGHHMEEEWIDVASIETYYTILKDFLLQVR